MYLLYLDDAGSPGNQNERHFMLAGIALFERHIFHLERKLESVAEETGLREPETLEFHGNQLLPGVKRWRALRGRERRREVLMDALNATQVLRGRWCLFGAVVDKAAVSPRDPVEYAFEQICSRFDQFLARQVTDGRSQKGLIILDRSTRETRMQHLAIEFRRTGHSWGVTRNIADVPFFVDSRATRAVQYADLVCYAMWQKFERNDPEFFNSISSGFDHHGGVVHGFFHERYATSDCDCLYCMTRRGL